MQLIDSIYATSSPKEKNQSNSPTSVVLTGYAPPSIFSTDGYYADSYEKTAISPLKIVDLDASIVRPPSEIESNRIERTRLQNAQNQTRRTHLRLPESVKHYLNLLFCGIKSMPTRILIAAGVAAVLLLQIPMEIRYTSGKPSSSLLLDLLERYETEKPIDMLFSFEVNYRVGGRSRKTLFSGRQSFDFPFTDADIRAIKKNR